MERVERAPETQYARSGDVNIAYQVVGDGPYVVELWKRYIDAFGAEDATVSVIANPGGFPAPDETSFEALRATGRPRSCRRTPASSGFRPRPRRALSSSTTPLTPIERFRIDSPEILEALT